MPPLRFVCLALLMGASATLGACDGGTSTAQSADVMVDSAAAADVPPPSDIPVATDAGVEAGPTYASAFTVVDLDPGAHPTLELAMRACAGLHNRALGGSVYVRKLVHDQEWIDELALTPQETLDTDSFLDACLATFPVCARYDFATQQALLPSIITAASALGAVPLDLGMERACDEVAFDATVAFAERDTPYLATQYVAENYLAQTSGLAMLNPGYDTQASDLANPPLTGRAQVDMVDLVFARRLFVVFLIGGCVDGNPEKELLQRIVSQSGWPTPIGVYGYNNSWLVGGYLYEAQTRCLDSRNMGAIPTETGNLSFFATRRPPITEEGALVSNPLEDTVYDPAKTYAAFVIGDGDNIHFIMTTRNVWLRQRLHDCAQEDNACAPLTWSISPHLTHVAPDVLEWYFASIRQTGRDYFTLPPSGHQYAYPASLNDEDQTRFAAATERDARVLGVEGTVHWEWFETWREAESRFLPRYARAGGSIRGIFPVNVPYMFPAFTWWSPDEFYRVIEGEDGGAVVVFRPRQWRGIDDRGTGIEEPFYLNPQRMADELTGYPPGTVTVIYTTSDGGLNLENSFMALVRLLPERVELVSADTASRLALAAAAAGD